MPFLLISYCLKSSTFLKPLTVFLSISSVSATSQTALIPYTASSLFPNETVWTNAVRVAWCLDHQAYCYNGTLDTGSTGILLSAADLENYNETAAALYPVGWQFLTSSKILYSGNWIPRNLTFPTASKDGGNATTTNVTAEVPILAVTKKVTCPGYNITTDGAECPANANATGETDMPVQIVYLGVGFGRQYNGQPQGNPDKNPFLNIIAINGEPTSADEMHAGYVVTNEGIQVGLTSESTKGFEEGKVKLVKQKEYSNDTRDWSQTGACISVTNSSSIAASTPSTACVNGTILVDTGIAQMYLTIPPSMPVTRMSQESASRPGTNVSVLADGQTVSVQFGLSANNPSLDRGGGDVAPSQDIGIQKGYSFVVGDFKDEVVPSQVITTVSRSKAPFVNTGRHFLRMYDVLFDARDGWFGVKVKGG